MADHDLDFEALLPDDASDRMRRRARAMNAHQERKNDRVALMLTAGELDDLSTALSSAIDLIKARIGKGESAYLRGRWSLFDDETGEFCEAALGLIEEDIARFEALLKRSIITERRHPANAEMRAHIEGQRDPE